MVVQHNLTAMNANRYLGINNSKLSKSLEKLSSGYAINRAGDNAAGLAVSEKMRSQIAGMTQGVKNAQDGISMVQTFEGALTETDSILQRMKTLADQMANGSYDDPIDRTAAQQEFLQLNDELDQIADTDFNGVIVLNGGKMADGLEAVDGMFDYANKADQVAAANAEALAKAQADAQAKIDTAQKNYDAAFNKYNAVSNRDLCLEGKAIGWNTVDNSQYDKTAANDLFDIDGKTAGTSLTDEGIEEIEVTYKYDETTGWSIDSASYVDADGQAQDITTNVKTVIDTVTSTDNGGFIASSGTPVAGSSANAQYGNVILDGTKAATGDVVTLKYTNAASSTYAPTNIGIDQNSLVNGVDKTTVPTLKLDAGIDDDNIDEETAAALDKLNKADISLMYSKDGIVADISDKDLQISETAAGKYEISYKNAKGNNITLATLETTAAHDASTGITTNKEITAAGNANADETKVLEYKVDADDATKTGWYDGTTLVGTNNVTVAGQTVTVAGAGVTGGTPIAGDKLTFTAKNGSDKIAVSYTGQEATVGEIKFGVALDHGNYDISNTKPTINPGKSKDGVDSTAIDKAFADAKAALDEAKAAYPNTVDDLSDEYKVSVSDAFDKSEAKMTYKDSITLQTGARTKDAVNFTFQYNSDAIGDLEADLNCTAKGLGTADLNLSTQEAANYAIDKIDQAINKVSLVRGTFGAIQNRLEHKIDNMNVSIENLTSAESQIRDTNMPEEMMNFTKQQILAQASQSMLAQANQLPQSVLSLLQ